MVYKIFNFVQGWDSTPAAEVAAFEGSNGIGKSQDFFDFPILEKTIDETCMEDIACSGCVNHVDLKTLDMEDFSTHQGHGSFRS